MSPVQRALVTGAGGFVGRHIVEAVLAAGGQAVAVDRVFDDEIRRRWAALWGGRLAIVEADSASIPPVDVDAVVHGAAVTAGPEEAGQTPEDNFRANLEPVLAMLEWAQRQRVRRAVFLSSSAVFRATPPGPLDETLPVSPDGVYAIAKAATESLVETLRAYYGRDVIAVRLSNIYGPGERARATRPRVSLVARLVGEALERGHVTVYRQAAACDWTFAPDIGRAIVGLLERPALHHHLYHVASGQVLAPLDIAETIQRVLPGVRVTVADGVDPETARLARRGFLSSARLQQETGFAAWTPFEEGLRQVIGWQRGLEAM